MADLEVLNIGRKKADNSPKFSADGNRIRLRFGRFVLDRERGCLACEGVELALRPKTFELLVYLANNAGRLISKNELLEAVWPDVVVTDDSLVQCVAELRKALEDEDHRLIRTVFRRGYRFDPAPAARW